MLPSLRLALALAACALAVTPARASADLARGADAFVNSIGVNTHIIYDDTAYGDFAGVRARLKELGVRHIRDGVCGSCVWQWERYETLAGDGIRLNAGAGWPTEPLEVRNGVLAAMRRLRPLIESVEGANEWDLFSGRHPAWPAQLRAHQAWLAHAVRSDPALRHIPIIGPSLVFAWETPSSWDILGDLSGSLDFGNLHSYPGGRPPETIIDGEFGRAPRVSGPRAVVATEAGYHNALGQGNHDHPAVPEDVAGVYMPRIFLENFDRWIVRTFAYELVDPWPGRAHVDMEASFGLLRADLSRKPAYVSLRNLIAVLSDPGPPVPSADVPLTIDSALPDLRRLLLRRRDGSLQLVLWRAASLWNTHTYERVPAVRGPVRVSLQHAPAAATVTEPVVSTDARPLAVVGTGVTLQVGAEPVVVTLAPPAAPAPESSPAPAPPPVPAPEPPSEPTTTPPQTTPTATPAPCQRPRYRRPRSC